MPDTTPHDTVAVLDDLVERQRQILGALVATTHPLRNDVQAVLLGMRGVVTKLRNGAGDDAATPDDSHGVRRLIVHPAVWDGLVRFLDVRGIDVTPYPDEDGIPTFGMGIKSLDVPALNADCTADEAACVHGQTADLTGLAAREDTR